MKRAYSTACIKNHEVVRGLPANSRVWSACVDIHPSVAWLSSHTSASAGQRFTRPHAFCITDRRHGASPSIPRVHHGVSRSMCTSSIYPQQLSRGARATRSTPHPPYLPTVALTCPPTTVRVGRTGARRCSSSCNCRRASRMHDRRVLSMKPPRPSFANIPFLSTIPQTQHHLPTDQVRERCPSGATTMTRSSGRRYASVRRPW